jgi:sugar phosphate isomerase/epimerase
MPLIHLKDYKVSLETLPDGKQDWRTVMTDIGQGNLDWDRILPAAEEAGCQWFIVENDLPGDAFAALGASFDYLRPRCQA